MWELALQNFARNRQGGREACTRSRMSLMPTCPRPEAPEEMLPSRSEQPSEKRQDLAIDLFGSISTAAFLLVRVYKLYRCNEKEITTSTSTAKTVNLLEKLFATQSQ